MLVREGTMVKFYETLESGEDVLIGSFHTWEEAEEALESYKINNTNLETKNIYEMERKF